MYLSVLFRSGFQIFLIGIYIPDIASVSHLIQDVMDGFKGSDHRMVDIVITVLAVAAHTIQIIDGIKESPELINILIGIKISRIRFF